MGLVRCQKKFSDAIKLCERIFDVFNDIYFSGKLPTPEFCFSPSNYGTVDVNNVLCIADEFSYKISIPTRMLNEKEYELAACILHNMIHIDGYIYDKQVDSNGQSYHNKRFRSKAEECGLEWTGDVYNQSTKPSDSFIKLCKEIGFKKMWKRKYSSDGTFNKKSSTRKYICPCCGTSFRATKEIRVMCMNCNEQFKEAI